MRKPDESTIAAAKVIFTYLGKEIAKADKRSLPAPKLGVREIAAQCWDGILPIFPDDWKNITTLSQKAAKVRIIMDSMTSSSKASRMPYRLLKIRDVVDGIPSRGFFYRPDKLRNVD